jgi:ATP-dependent HslUV protease subunit HslV
VFKNTTIISIRREGNVVFAGDGQVSLQHTIVKNTANKIRKIENQSILVGFAGSSADAMILFDMFEKKIKLYPQLIRASVELVKEWRTSNMLKKLDALLLVADKDKTLLISGAGDILEPDIEICAIGSGGNYALAAARALLENTKLPLDIIARKSLDIAASICLYTNKNIILQSL